MAHADFIERDVELEGIFNMLECRIAAYATQLFIQQKVVKEILQSRPQDPCEHEFYRIVLRSNRLAAYMKAENHFERIGILGKGSYGVVDLVKGNENERYYALKTVILPKTRQKPVYMKFAFVERDCALVANNDSFVKLKGAWVEINNGPDKPDCYKFLWENIPYGDLFQVYKQLHPLAIFRTVFDPNRQRNRKYFSYHDGTFHSMTDGVPFELLFNVKDKTIATVYAEKRIIEEGGKMEIYKQICYKYLMQLMKAIDFLHSKNITHQDLKPQNVLVAADLSLRVADLGMASSFNALHASIQYQWTNKKFLTQKEQVKMIMQGAEGHHQFYKARLSKKDKLDMVGTLAYLGPEHGGMFYADRRYRDVRFNKMSARSTDYYAIGCMIFELMTGIHPLMQCLDIYEDVVLAAKKSLPFNDKLDLIKINPNIYNPLLKPMMGVTDDAFQKLIIDKRIHDICVKLLEPDPRKRMDLTKMLENESYKEITREPYASQPLIFEWDSLLRERKPTRCQQILAEHRAGKIPLTIPPPAEWSQIFAQPGFPIMTDSPGTIASP